MSESPPLVCPAPRINKACASCRSRKLRCLPTNTAGICKRCMTEGITCQYSNQSSETTRSNVRRKLQTQDFNLPSKRNNGSKLHEDEDVLDDLFQSKSSQPKTDPVDMIQNLHRSVLDKILPSSPDWSLGTTPESASSFVFKDLSLEDNGSKQSPPERDRKFNVQNISHFLRQFQESQTYFPFIVLPDDITAQIMMKDHPFLLLGIITAMAVNDPPVHHRLDAKFRRVLAQKTIEHDEKSLDLLQGLLVYIAWYPMHINPRSLQVFKFLQIAAGMISDLKLDRPPNAKFDLMELNSSPSILSDSLDNELETAQAGRLVYLGCYFLSTAMSLPLGRKTHATFTPYTQFCVDIVSITDNELRAQVLVKLQRIAEEATELSKSGDVLTISTEVETLLSRLQALEQSYSAELSSHPSIRLTHLFVGQKIHSLDLPPPNRQALTTIRLTSIHLLSKCLDSTVELLNYIISLPVTEYKTFTKAEWNRVVEPIIILSRLCFPIPAVPEWDAVAAREKAGFDSLLLQLSARMNEVSASVTTEKRLNLNIFLMFSSVLDVVREKYQEKIALYESRQRDLAGFFGPGTPHDELEPKVIRGSQCPVMNGSLEGTEYWEAMQSWNATVTLDAGFGEGMMGNEMFDTNVLEDWCLWGVKLPDWNEAVDAVAMEGL